MMSWLVLSLNDNSCACETQLLFLFNIELTIFGVGDSKFIITSRTTSLEVIGTQEY